MLNMEQHAKEIEDIIYSYLPKEEGYQKIVLEAMNYTMESGGKRIRPMMMLETYKMFGGETDVIYPFMAAIEMIHTYSLIHDDLPALDNDDLRRGRKTAHVVFGEAMAILAGDGLLNYAFEVAAGTFLNYPGDEKIGKAFTVLTRKPGIYGMIGGQVADVNLTGSRLDKEQLDFIYRLKTGALLEASMMIGAILAGAGDEEVSQIEKIAANVGMAFQIQDDILDVTGDEAKLGKPLHSDERNEKTTFVTLYGIEHAKNEVMRLSNEAVAMLEALPYENPFLKDLILALIHRTK